MIPFVKMHGCGNDFVVVRAADLDALGLDAGALADFVRAVCARHVGIGADGLLAYAAQPNADRVRMRYWNRDGGAAEMCGNGARCVVRLAFERDETRSPLALETASGVLDASITRIDGTYHVEIRLGPARWDADAVGLVEDTELVEAPFEVAGETWRVTALSMGNPHAVVFVDSRQDWQAVELGRSGAALSEHPRFRHGANVSFVHVADDGLHVRVWERGSGATLACGTAACAVTAAARRLRRLTALESRVCLPGGDVWVREDSGSQLWLRGPASRVADGVIDASLVPGHGADAPTADA